MPAVNKLARLCKVILIPLKNDKCCTRCSTLIWLACYFCESSQSSWHVVRCVLLLDLCTSSCCSFLSHAFFSTIHLRSSEISFYSKRLSEKEFNGRCSSCLLTGLSQLSLKPATKPCILWPQRVRGWCIWCYLSVEVIQAQRGGLQPCSHTWRFKDLLFPT